jgi:TRAP-type mannitol/chloroaromatic compound transport system permease small subunit
MAIVLAALLGLLAISPLLRLGRRSGRAPGRLAGIARKIVDGAFWIGTSAGLLLVFVVVATIVTRDVFGINFIWLQESAIYLFGLLVLLCPAAILLVDGHVRVDVLYANWSPRRQAIVDLIGLAAFVIPLGMLILIVGWPYAAASWAILEGSATPTGIPAVFLLKSLAPLLGFLILLASFVRMDGRVADLASAGAAHA